MEENLYAPPTAVVADVAPIKNDEGVLFFPVSTFKLVLLSVCTLGLYQIYWFYKNWALIRERSEPHIIPWARALFGFFWCYSFFNIVREEEKRLRVDPTLAAGPLAIVWIVMTLTSRLPAPYALICFLSSLPLIPVQWHVNHLNRLAAPDHHGNTRLSVWNWLVVVVGGILFGLVLLGLALPRA